MTDKISTNRTPLRGLTDVGFHERLIDMGHHGLADTFARGRTKNSTPDDIARADRLRAELIEEDER